MLAKAQKWGNSLALRIPKAVAKDLDIQENDQLDIRVVEDAIVVTPKRVRKYDLNDLLAGVTDDNLHDEADFGEPVGREVL
jgi:antitoxin MazE